VGGTNLTFTFISELALATVFKRYFETGDRPKAIQKKENEDRK
jgi:hypothetical protein